MSWDDRTPACLVLIKCNFDIGTQQPTLTFPAGGACLSVSQKSVVDMWQCLRLLTVNPRCPTVSLHWPVLSQHLNCITQSILMAAIVALSASLWIYDEKSILDFPLLFTISFQGKYLPAWKYCHVAISCTCTRSRHQAPGTRQPPQCLGRVTPGHKSNVISGYWLCRLPTQSRVGDNRCFYLCYLNSATFRIGKVTQCHTFVVVNWRTSVVAGRQIFLCIEGLLIV